VFLEGRVIGEAGSHEAGRKLLAEMYRRYAGEEMPPVLVTERGKPYFQDSPWHFSISHSKSHVFCALSQKNIGIDAEECDRAISTRLADKILSPVERQQYDRAEDKRLALLRFWVLKEAQAKMTGEGIKFHPTHTEFLLSDPRVRELQGCLVAVIEEENHVI
jgi:phosphopantetheinyl transferase